MSQFDKLIEDHQILSFIGTGGVGKTTFSIVAAVAAAKKGRRVAAITVDPSKRLSTALGISEETIDCQTLDWPELEGRLDVYVLDTERTFQDFVRQSLPASYRDKIGQNRIFKQISKNLRETHNFSAIYKLYEIYKSGRYDIIVLDTPPAQAAIDFFEAPQQLKNFFSFDGFQKIEKMKWLSWVGEKSLSVFNSMIKRFAGEEFLDEMYQFFKHVSELRFEIEKVTSELLDQMSGDDCRFVLVTSAARDKFEESQFLLHQLKEQQFTTHHCIINQAYYWWLDESAGERPEGDPEAQSFYNCFVEQKKQAFGLLEKFASDSATENIHSVLMPILPFKNIGKAEIFNLLDLLSKNWARGNEIE